MRLLIMGPQGVGKGTQAKRLADYYGVPHISTGDIFRYNLANHTALGEEAATYINQGRLVPDRLTNDIIADRLRMEDCVDGWILDGYPRNADQVKFLDTFLMEIGEKLDAVVLLEAGMDVLMERMTKRAELEGRSDDTPDVIRKRLEIYEEETAPLIGVYEAKGLLVRVNGVGEISEITRAIVGALYKRFER